MYGYGGARRTYAYDDLDRLTSDTLATGAGSLLASTTYEYDKDDHLKAKTTTGTVGAGRNTFDYDDAGRLTRWINPSNVATDYNWDAAGNRTQAGSANFTYDQRNRLISGGGSTHTYTARGTLAAQTTGGDKKGVHYDRSPLYLSGDSLSSRAFATVQKFFASEAEAAFSFLVDEFGLAGPEYQGVALPVVAYIGSGLRYRVMLEVDDKAIRTRIETDLERTRLVADLENLIGAAGLGSRAQISRSAHTLNGLRGALNSQAKSVRLLHPLATGPDVIDLMKHAHAREWRIQ